MISKKWYLVREAGQRHWNGPFELVRFFGVTWSFLGWEKKGPYKTMGEGWDAIDCCGECDELDP